MAQLPPPDVANHSRDSQVIQVRTEIHGFPKVSDPIQDLPTSMESIHGSTRAYTPLKILGQGPFSTVMMCHWHSILHPHHEAPPLIKLERFGEGTRLIALKSFVVPQDRDLSTVRELEFLRILPPHRNIITLYDYFFTPEDRRLYLAFGAMEGNLYHLIRTRNGRHFAGGLVSSILHEILLGLDWMHSNHYAHRDLMPENVLVTTQGLFQYPAVPVISNTTDGLWERDVIVVIKLADFGLARETTSEGPYTEYVSVRWYRAPEVILFTPRHTSAIDMWAFGVIAAELLNLAPLFPGTDQINQLSRICDVLGHPSDEARVDRQGDPMDGGAWPAGIELARAVGFTFPQVIPRSLSSFFNPTTPISLVSYIKDLLAYDPQRRLTSRASLNHQYFRETAPHREVDLSRAIVNLESVNS